MCLAPALVFPGHVGLPGIAVSPPDHMNVSQCTGLWYSTQRLLSGPLGRVEVAEPLRI